ANPAPSVQRAPAYDAQSAPSVQRAPAYDVQPAPTAYDAPSAYDAPPPPSAQSHHPARTALPSQSPAMITENGSAFDAPVRPPMPEWLRVAQQNNMPLEERRRALAPRVSAAPQAEAEAEVAPPPTDVLGRPLRSRAALQQTRSFGQLPQTADEYERAGYPPELLKQQQALEHERSQQAQHRRHGAQYAINPEAQEAYERSVGTAPASRATASYPPARERPGDRRTREGRQPSQNSAEERYTPPPRANRRQAAAPTEEGRYSPRQDASASDNPYAAQSYAADPSAPTAYVHQAPPRHAANPRHLQEGADQWQDEESEQSPMYQERPPIPWLGICMFVAALLAVGLWLMQLTFTAQTAQVIQARKENNEALLSRHPFRYQELIEREAGKNNLNPAFVAAIVLNESSFKPDAESSVGARGLMQLMDKTAEWVHEKMGKTDAYSFDAMYDAETNVQYGCWYIAFLNERFRGDPVLVSAAFHAGQNQVQNWLNDSRYSADNLTLELQNMQDGPTKQYATRVVRDYAIYKRLYYETAKNEP
ncbi:MAG: transglycosylase SLT domain-containing protein, partial [Clostridia bacterium]